MKQRNYEEQQGSAFWSPEKEGDVLEGQIAQVDMDGPYGPRYMIRKDSDGEEIATPSHKVLQARMAKAKQGDFVRITYEGMEPPAVKGNHPTRMYKVELATD